MKKLMNKLKKQVAPEAPRALEDIKRENSELLAKAGNAQYIIHVYENELRQINARLLELNNEAGQRNQLDAAVQAEAKKEESNG